MILSYMYIFKLITNSISIGTKIFFLQKNCCYFYTEKKERKKSRNYYCSYTNVECTLYRIKSLNRYIYLFYTVKKEKNTRFPRRVGHLGGQPNPESVDRLYTLFTPLKAGLLPAAAKAEAGLSNPVSFQ